MDVSSLKKGRRISWQESNGTKEGAFVCLVPAGESAVDAALAAGVKVLDHEGLTSRLADEETGVAARVLIAVSDVPAPMSGGQVGTRYRAVPEQRLRATGELLPDDDEESTTPDQLEVPTKVD